MRWSRVAIRSMVWRGCNDGFCSIRSPSLSAKRIMGLLVHSFFSCAACRHEPQLQATGSLSVEREAAQLQCRGGEAAHHAIGDLQTGGRTRERGGHAAAAPDREGPGDDAGRATAAPAGRGGAKAHRAHRGGDERGPHPQGQFPPRRHRADRHDLAHRLRPQDPGPASGPGDRARGRCGLSLFQGLETNRIDLVVIPGTYWGQDYATVKVGQVDDYWMASPSIPLPDRPLQPAEFANYPILEQSTGAAKNRYYAGWLAEHGFKFNKVLATNSTTVLRQLAIGGFGIAQMALDYVRPDIEAGRLRIVRMRPHAATDGVQRRLPQGRRQRGAGRHHRHGGGVLQLRVEALRRRRGCLAFRLRRRATKKAGHLGKCPALKDGPAARNRTWISAFGGPNSIR